jgi:hypothetical protein
MAGSGLAAVLALLAGVLVVGPVHVLHAVSGERR